MAGQFDSVLLEAASRLGFEGVRPDGQGLCTLDFGGTFMNISCVPGTSLVRLAVPVASIEGECPREVLERLLDAQFFFKDTRGTTFSYQKESGAVLLHCSLHLAVLDGPALENAVRNMLAVADAFGAEIAAMLDAHGAEPAPVDAAAPWAIPV